MDNSLYYLSHQEFIDHVRAWKDSSEDLPYLVEDLTDRFQNVLEYINMLDNAVQFHISVGSSNEGISLEDLAILVDKIKDSSE